MVRYRIGFDHDVLRVGGKAIWHGASSLPRSCSVKGAVILYSAVYTGMSTGEQIWTLSLYLDRFLTMASSLSVERSGRFGLHWELGVGVAWESGLSDVDDFLSDAFVIERVAQIGPIVVVLSSRSGVAVPKCFSALGGEGRNRLVY